MVRTTRRTWLAGAGLGLTAACGRRKGTGFPGYALIATAGENSLSVVNLMEFRLEEPIPLGAAPTAVVPGNNGVSYVLTPASGSVHLISPARKAISSVHLGPGVTQIRQTPDGKALVGISPETAELTRAEVDNFKTRRTHQLKAKPYAMDAVALNSAHDLLAISEGESGWVELFDFASGKRWSRQLGGRIGDLRFRADGRLLLVANLAGRSLTALSVPKLEPIADLPLAMNPENLCFDKKDQGQLFVTGEGMDGVAIVFPYRVLQVDQTVLAGRDPGVMASSANPALLFVASASGSDICVLNIDSRKVIGLVDVAEHPTYITITPDDQYALILNRSSGDLAVIRIPAIRTNPAIVISKSGASLFTMLSVGSQPVHAAVIRSQA